jgi:hypothetical protein
MDGAYPVCRLGAVYCDFIGSGGAHDVTCRVCALGDIANEAVKSAARRLAESCGRVSFCSTFI